MKLITTTEHDDSLNMKIDLLMKAARKVLPIVGAATASASNDIRPLREKAYNQLREAMEYKTL